jgi:hypothetical protein
LIVLKPEDYAENNGALGRLSVMHSCTSVQQFTPDAVTEAVELSIGKIWKPICQPKKQPLVPKYYWEY